ncbi:S1 family peptidase [Streptosporangium sp. NPDC048865]|uniref:S1 family peptidase n=1 Tax=Streptosporangium sp. NPDC048865 TaxID=3155766 RepID=UPI0034491E0A
MARRHIVTTGCVLGVTALGLAAGPVAGGRRPVAATAASPAWRSPPSPGMLQALQRDLRLSREQVQTRLRNEVRLVPVRDELRKTLADRFAGAWLSGPLSQTLVVATTRVGDIPAILAAGARAEIVTRSLAQLRSIKRRLDAAPPVPPRAGCVRYIDVRKNKVVVLAQVSEQAEAIIHTLDVDKEAVRVVPTVESPQILTEIRGGEAYYLDPVGRCSVGFAVTKAHRTGFVSAGHCGRPGAAVAGPGRGALGVVQESTFPGGDHSWVAVRPTWRPVPEVSTGGTDGAVPVAGARPAIEGASICRSGSATDFHCGVIQQREATVVYPQGAVSGLTRTNICAEAGDSGGPFIAVDQAQGITSGGSGECGAGGTSYFQPIGPILTAYGLTLLTTGAPRPPVTATAS